MTNSRPHSRLDPETRRALLVDAAAGVFRGRDPSEVAIEEVAAAGGVSRALIYAYFGDRGGLLAAVYLHNLERLDQEVGRALEAQVPDELRLRRLVRRYLLFARDHRDSWDLMIATGAIGHPAIQAARRDRIERIASSWAAEPSARLIAHSVVGLLEAGTQDWIAYRDCGIERATNVLLAMLWEGLAGLRGRGILTAS